MLIIRLKGIKNNVGTFVASYVGTYLPNIKMYKDCLELPNAIYTNENRNNLDFSVINII